MSSRPRPQASGPSEQTLAAASWRWEDGPKESGAMQGLRSVWGWGGGGWGMEEMLLNPSF